MKLTLFLFLYLLFFSAFSSEPLPVAEDVVGLSKQQLLEKYPKTKVPSASFLNLVSKNLHPYHAPREHVFLRYGDAYIVFELKDNQVIALHKVSG